MDREFETDLARELYFEVSALMDVRRIKRRYITLDYIWKLWKRVYKENCGCTKYFINPEE